MRIDWITDPHLTHLQTKDALYQFLDKLHERESDALFVTGDIAESHTIYDCLGLLSGAYQRPIYFVLGNHDFYGDWMSATAQKVRQVCSDCPPGILNWMSDIEGFVALTDDVALVGHDGWYCGQEGSGIETTRLRPDFASEGGVRDLTVIRDRHRLWKTFHILASNAAEHVFHGIRASIQNGFKKTVVLTHMPPLREATIYRGKICGDASAPFYVNGIMGHVLRDLARKHPDHEIEVFAGHTHAGHCHVEDNLTVNVGTAHYSRRVQFLPERFF